jgi:hypothetical protein
MVQAKENVAKQGLPPTLDNLNKEKSRLFKLNGL